MGWERRGNKVYYYEKKRQGKKVVSVYLGRDDLAELLAESNLLIKQSKITEKIWKNKFKEDLTELRELKKRTPAKNGYYPKIKYLIEILKTLIS
ncbi:MAG: hypothetical protein WAQ98_29580 [Blastocatellia bacterium]